MNKEGSGRVKIPLALEEPEYDFKLNRGWKKFPNPLVETILPPYKKSLLNKFTLKQLKDAIREMNDMGLTNVQGFSQISRPALIKLIYENPEYFGIPRIKIIPKKKTYFNWEDKEVNENEPTKWKDTEDLEQDKKRYFRKLKKQQSKK